LAFRRNERRLVVAEWVVGVPVATDERRGITAGVLSGLCNVRRRVCADSSDADGTDGDVTTWLLLEGNRLGIAGGVVLLIVLVLLAVLWTYGLDVLNPESPMYFLFGSLLTGDLTLLTIVLSINQLVLSRELGAPGDLRQRIDGAVGYRREVEASTDAGVSPKSPAGFLEYLHESVRTRAAAFEEETAGGHDEELRRRGRALADSVREDVRVVNRALEDDRTHIFSVVAATLATNHASQLHAIAAIRNEHDDSLTDEQQTELERIEDQLLQIDVARKYFRTVYVQKELAYLSRILLYVGVPAIVASGLALVFYNAALVTTVPQTALLTAVVGSFALGFAPLAILFAFVLRLARVAQKTATVPPFTSESGYRP